MENNEGLELLKSLSKKGKKILVHHPFSDNDLHQPELGSSRLIAEEIKTLQKNGIFGGTVTRITKTHSLLRSINTWLTTHKQLAKQMMRMQKARATAYLISVMAVELAKKIYMKPIRMSPETVVILNSPFSISLFDSEPVRIILEHNVEWKFHEEEAGRNFITGMMLTKLRAMELECLKKADYVFCLNVNDRATIINEGINREKIKMWVPQSNDKSRVKIRTEYSGKFVVGYLGSNFKPNIVAVRIILKLAKEVPDAIFLIVGKVNEAFEGQKIPKNVIMKGHAPDLDSSLSCCDIFINPKITSDTGAEMKMLDYLRHSKKIIATEIGARGFESEKNIIICGPDQMKAKIREVIGSQ